MNKVLVIIISGILALGCSDYSKILKSKDYNLKFEKAKEYYHDGELFGNKNEMRGFQNGNRPRERGSPRGLLDDDAGNFERNDQRDQYDNYLKFAGKRGKHQSAGSFNI